MFFREIEDREAHPELVAAADASYARIERAILEFLEPQGEAGVSPKIAINGAWAVVHGLSNLLNEGRITPGERGNPGEDELIDTILELFCAGLDRGVAG